MNLSTYTHKLYTEIYTNNKLTYIENNIIILIYIHTYIHTYMQLDRKVQEWLRTTAAGPVRGWLLVANRLVKRWPRNTTAAPARQWLRISAARTVLDHCGEL